MKKGSKLKTDQLLAKKIFIAIVFFLVAYAVVGLGYYRFFILRDYDITGKTDCDPQTEECFIYMCDPALDEECSEDPVDQMSYYKLIRKKANLLPFCLPGEDGCPVLACNPGEECEEILCNADNVPEGEDCNDPQRYLEENSPSDEE